MGGEAWKRIPLGEFVTLQRGHDLPDEQRRPAHIPILGSFGITGWHDEAKARGPGVTVGRSGASFGVASYSPVDYWPLNTALYVIDFHGNDERFSYYFLKLFDFHSYNSGSAQPSLNRNVIHPVLVDIPPVDEQRAIAHILGTLDDKLELNRRMNETLEAMSRALYKSWFADFDPVRAKAEGRDAGLPKQIADLFPDSFEDSELGEIPKGWGVQKVGEIGNVVCGKTPPTGVSEYYGNDVPFITIPDMHSRIFATTVQKRLSHAGANSQLKKMLPAGSICVSCIATAGLVVITSEAAQTNQQINSVIPSQKDATHFWFWSLRNLGEDIKAGGSGGSVLTNLSTGRFSELRLLSGNARIRSVYHSLVKPLFDRILANERESRTLAALRDALLPKLISGEIRVKDAERYVGRVL